MDWGTYLTTSEDVIYGTIDGRGSGYRGDDLLFEIHYKLGKPEVADQIEVTKKLVGLYDFIDRKNVAIWGWSYGGGYRFRENEIKVRTLFLEDYFREVHFSKIPFILLFP